MQQVIKGREKLLAQSDAAKKKAAAAKTNLDQLAAMGQADSPKGKAAAKSWGEAQAARDKAAAMVMFINKAMLFYTCDNFRLEFRDSYMSTMAQFASMMTEHYKRMQLDCGVALAALGVADAATPAAEAKEAIGRCRDVDAKSTASEVLGAFVKCSVGPPAAEASEAKVADAK